MLIDRFMPVFEVVKRHAIEVDADQATTYEAAKSLDLGQSLPIQILVGIRSIPAYVTGRRKPTASFRLMDMLGAGFVLLEEQPDDEIVMGAVGRFWRPTGGMESVAREDFVAFDQPGFAKGVMNVRVEGDEFATRLSTETRVLCTDDRSRRSFARYWRVIGPFSALIRRLMLQKMKAAAERPRV